MPTKITYSSGKSASYIYNGAGEKLRTSYKASASATAVPTDYCGNMIYENNVLKQILIDGGYIAFSGPAHYYYYYLKDHLGNNRVVVSPSGTPLQVNHYYPFGGLFGESTGNSLQRFRFNGKEFDRTHGLDWYDYGARHMTPDVGRFTTIDPMAEKYYNISPYAYCANNPVKYIDPDGRIIVLGKGVSNSFKKDYELVVKTLKEKGCGDVWDKLNKSKEVYTIIEGNSDFNFFDYSDKTITWNSRKGLYTSNDNYISPATRLNHELDHALQYDNNPEQYKIDIITPAISDDETYTIEEKRVIEGTESKTARNLGEIENGSLTRNDHTGRPFLTDSPISNKDLYPQDVIIYPQ